jgi:hypothetical protein
MADGVVARAPMGSRSTWMGTATSARGWVLFYLHLVAETRAGGERNRTPAIELDMPPVTVASWSPGRTRASRANTTVNGFRGWAACLSI